jgi:hypothetical protein
MTTARQRYEQRTKVITFRIGKEDSDKLEAVRAKAELSYADLIKLGGGIAQEEITAKLAQISGLESRLAELSSAIEQKEAEINQFLDEERARRLGELDREMNAFRLFEQGWSPEAVAEKLSLAKKTASDYLENWAKGKKDKQLVEQMLVVKCLQEHRRYVQGQIRWCRLFPWQYNENQVNELEEQLESLQQLLGDPSKISQDNKQWLLAEYSSRV